MLGFPKPSPKLLDKRQQAADLARIDREQRAICRVRSGGHCEVLVVLPWGPVTRCDRRATENHHLLGGIGRRNKGRSLLAAHRLDVCQPCHEEITGHVLVPCVEQQDAERADSVRYERRTR